MKLPLSAIVLTHNSARTIEKVLKSLAWCAEILVVDSGSEDQTMEIATRMGARVLKRTFTGFGDQKNWAVSSATHDWVFVVDSDEVVSEALRSEIFSVFKEGHGSYVGYYVPIQLIFLGEEMRFSGNTITHALRFFNRQNGNFNLALVHELVNLEGERKRLKNHLSHYSYLLVEDYFNKFNRYTTFGARELYRMRKRPGFFKIWFGFPFCFFKMYFVKLGFLDGYPGFIWCLFSSLSPVVKYVKLKELLRLERTSDMKTGQWESV